MILSAESARAELQLELRPLLGWTSATGDAGTDQLAAIYQSIGDERVPGAIVPVRGPDRIWFCAVANNASDWRRLSPLIMAAAGMTLTTFDGRPGAPPTPGQSEPFASRGLEFTWFHSKPGDRRNAADCIEALDRMVRMLRTSPVGLRELPRSPAQLLHQFDLAVLAGDRVAADASLRELEQRRAVDALNLNFLRVRWHATFLEWRELRSERWFPSLTRTRRPPQVTSQLVRALLEVDLGGLATPADPRALVERFSRTVAPEAGSVFEELPAVAAPPIATMFLLDAIDRGDDWRVAELRQLDRESWESPARTRFEGLLGLVPVAEPPGSARSRSLEAALDRFLEGGEATEQQRTALAALRSGSESVTLERVIDAVTANGLLQARTPDLPLLETAVSDGDVQTEPVPTSWTEWFALTSVGFQRSREYALRLADETSVREQVPDEAARERFIDSFSLVASTDPQRASAALPHLVDWMQRDPEWPSAEYAPVYEQLITVFLLVDSRSVDALRSALTILDGWLALGPQATQYAELLSDLRGELSAFVSERALDALIDAAELLVIHPCPDESARGSLWSELVGRLGTYQTFLTPSQFLVLNSLCDAIGAPQTLRAATTAPVSVDPVTTWKGVIGLYTLRPDVAQNVTQALGRLLPLAEVVCREDHVATDALRHLVVRSDVMAVDASAAKHPATDGIKTALVDRSPLWLKGGASSIVSDVLTEVRRVQEYSQAGR